MGFLAVVLVIGLLQLLHLQLLRLEVPERHQRWLPWALAALHVPVALYAAVRFLAPGEVPLPSALRTLARLGFYFQALTVLHLFLAMAAEGLWRIIRRPEPEPEAEKAGVDPSRRAFLRTAAAASIGAASALGYEGAREAYGDPLVTRRSLFFPDLPPGLEGLRLVQLSDLHAGPLVGPSLLRRWRDLAERERPELLLVTGDLVDSRADELGPLLDAFRGFRPPLGTFAVLGNHDYFDDPRPIWRALRREGITPLENRASLVSRGGSLLALVGLQDPMASNGRFRHKVFGPGPRPDLATRGLPEGAFRICLNHRPSEWNAARQAGARLTLSGHTHGGQINLLPGLSSARILGPYTDGLYRLEEDLLYVSRGLGVVGLPMRIQAPPELVVLELRRGLDPGAGTGR
ncbi:MAG TPA: metallophosphoesterase [Holophagaceae bacterium]